MPQVINTNVASLNAQRNLNKSQNSLQTSLQRLSSGLRINSAKDDAAGLAISDRMTAQIRGMNQASRNAADAISLAQTGEAALQEITNNLQRMRELAVQSRNPTNTDADRVSLDSEYQQLLSEVDRIATTTAFNSRKILDGSLGSTAFQVGANVGETISIDVSSSVRSNAIGNVASTTLDFEPVTVAAAATIGALVSDPTAMTATGDITINSTNLAFTAPGTAGTGAGSAFYVGAAINAETATTGVTAQVGETTAQIDASDLTNFLGGLSGLDADDTYSMSINGVSVITAETAGAFSVSSASDLVSKINGVVKQTGVVASLDANDNITLRATDGRNIEVGELVADGATSAADGAITGLFGDSLAQDGGGDDAIGNTFKASIVLQADRDIVVGDTATNADKFFVGIADNSTSTTSASTVDSSNVLTTAEADTAILKIDEAINDVDTLRGTFGAIQSRFDSTIANLQSASENVSAARSRILDADFAMETANLTRAQILQQAGVSVLSQANALPQGVLALLQ